MEKMTRPDRDERLSSSDLLRLERIPGFEDALVSTTLRITQSGWAAFWIESFLPVTGQEAFFKELRLEDDMGRIRELVDLLKEQPQSIGTTDDIGSRIIRCRRYDMEHVFCIEEAFDLETRHTFYGDPSFVELWDFVHRPFASLFPKT